MESNNFVSGLLAGAILGVAAGILLTSSLSGETKEKLVKGAKKVTDSLGETVSDTIEDLKEQYNEGVEQVTRKANEKISTYSERAKG